VKLFDASSSFVCRLVYARLHGCDVRLRFRRPTAKSHCDQRVQSPGNRRWRHVALDLFAPIRLASSIRGHRDTMTSPVDKRLYRLTQFRSASSRA
jgi:hypothetical protein